MKTCIVPTWKSHIKVRSCKSLRIVSGAQVVFIVLYQSQLVRLCFQLFSSKLKNSCHCHWHWVPHTTVTKKAGACFLPPLVERRKASMRNSHLHPLSWPSRWSHQQSILSNALVKPEWSNIPYLQPWWWSTLTEDKKLEKQQIGKIYYVFIMFFYRFQKPHKRIANASLKFYADLIREFYPLASTLINVLLKFATPTQNGSCFLQQTQPLGSKAWWSEVKLT